MTPNDYADLVVVAPTAAECRTSGWLQEAVHAVGQKLESNGVAYVLVPPRWRLRIRKQLSEQGLSIDQEIIHLPDQDVSRYLIPINPITIHYAFSKLLPLPDSGRVFATLASRTVGCEQLFRHVLPSIGMAVRRSGARSLLEWLFKLEPDTDGRGNVIIRTSWRGKDGAVIFYRFLEHAHAPSAVAKLSLAADAGRNRLHEGEVLGRLGPRARGAGVQIPRPLSIDQLHGRPLLLQTMICGQSAGSVLTSKPHRLSEILDSLIRWMEFWNQSTVATCPLGREFIEKGVLAPVTFISPLIEQGEQYRDWVTQCCLALVGSPTALVATHNDLTMWNIVVSNHKDLGVIDWEHGNESGLPFTDFFYAVTDAVTVGKTDGDRVKAFKECFAVGGIYEDMMRQYLMRLRRVVHVSDEMIGLCFHACWIHHATNEYGSTDSSHPRPFLQLVQWLSLNRATLCRWIHG